MKNLKNLVAVMLLLSTATALPMKRQLDGAAQEQEQEAKRQCTVEQEEPRFLKLQWDGADDNEWIEFPMELIQYSDCLKGAVEFKKPSKQELDHPIKLGLSQKGLKLFLDFMKTVHEMFQSRDQYEQRLNSLKAMLQKEQETSGSDFTRGIEEINKNISANSIKTSNEMLKVISDLNLSQLTKFIEVSDFLQIKVHGMLDKLMEEYYKKYKEVAETVQEQDEEGAEAKYAFNPTIAIGLLAKQKLLPAHLSHELLNASGGAKDKLISYLNALTVTKLEGHTASAMSACFSPDGKICASGSADNTIKLWSMVDGHCIKTLTGHTNWVLSVCFSPDGKTLASGSRNGDIMLWNVEDGECIRTFNGHTKSVNSVCFSSSGNSLVSGSDDCTVKIWSVEGGNCTMTLDNAHSVQSVCSAPSDKIIAYGQGNEIKLLGKSIEGFITLKGHEGEIQSVCFSPDGKILASASRDGSVRLWNVADRTCIKTLSGHTASVASVSFSPDGKMLVSGSSDKTVKLWSVETGDCIKTLYAISARSVCFSPDGQKVAIGGMGFKVTLWDITQGDFSAFIQDEITFEQAALLKIIGCFGEKNKTLDFNQTPSELKEIFESLPEDLQETLKQKNLVIV